MRWPRDHDEGDLIVSEMEKVIPALVASVLEQHATGDHCCEEVIRQAMERQVKVAVKPGPVRVDVSIAPPWSDGQVNSVQVVMDDRPFLVDTVVSCLLRHGWRVEDVRHPIFGVKRNAEGVSELPDARAASRSPGFTSMPRRRLVLTLARLPSSSMRIFTAALTRLFGPRTIGRRCKRRCCGPLRW